MINRIDAFLRRIKCGGYLLADLNIDDIVNRDNFNLSFKGQCSNHCLFHLLPPLKTCANLTPRGHDFMLPDIITALHRHSFITQCLFEYVSVVYGRNIFIVVYFILLFVCWYMCVCHILIKDVSQCYSHVHQLNCGNIAQSPKLNILTCQPKIRWSFSSSAIR